MQARTQQRQRPLPPVVAWARRQFHSIWAFDGSSLDGLLKKCGLLRERSGPVLAGKLGTLLDVATHLQHFVWCEEDSQTHDMRFWPQVLSVVSAGCLLLLDKGLIDFAIFDQLTNQHTGFITHPKSNTQVQVTQVLSRTAALHDCQIVWGGPQIRCDHRMRLVTVLFHGKWYLYLTNVLDPAILPPECMVALYDQRWRIEDTFNVVKRLLGLTCFYTRSINGLQLQVWTTWLLYALLVDLTDAVADALHRPFRGLSLKLIFRGLYHFARDRQRGLATDAVAYFARRAQDLDLIKQKRPQHRLSLVEQLNLTIPLVS